MRCMTVAPESTTGESEKVGPASGIRCEGNPFSIADERNDGFQHGSSILCSLLAQAACGWSHG